jgi:hypothetical protein
MDLRDCIALLVCISWADNEVAAESELWDICGRALGFRVCVLGELGQPPLPE